MDDMRIGKYMSEDNKKIVREIMPLAGAVLDMRHGRYTAKALNKLDTIKEGLTSNLKIDTGRCRVWLSRLTTLDGMPYDNMITVEIWQSEDGIWRMLDMYAGGVLE